MKNKKKLHLSRKIWHVTTGLAGLGVYYLANLSTYEAAMVCFTMTFLDLVLELSRLHYSALNKLFMKVMGPFLKTTEKNTLSGFPYYTLGCGLSFYFFTEPIAILSILFLIFADPLSSAFGILYGKDQLFSNKTLQGSIAGVVVCYIISLAYGMMHDAYGTELLVFSLLAGIVGSISEMISYGHLDDNLSIPVISGLGITFLNLFFNFF
ncbi:MAG: hypothetical protein OXB84_04855 [Halobacteriovoraceae bacterium]|nr:hypothetical protein [Halobacteriovoraceae bacterium]